MTTNQLTPAKWIEALRSGEYTQTQKELRSIDNFQKKSYCCLGVACDLYDSKIWAPDAFPFSIVNHKVENLPNEVQTHLHLRNPEGTFAITYEWLSELNSDLAKKIPRHARLSLANLNDSGFTFEEIADIIESNPPGLFEEGFYA